MKTKFALNGLWLISADLENLNVSMLSKRCVKVPVVYCTSQLYVMITDTLVKLGEWGLMHYSNMASTDLNAVSDAAAVA